MAEIENLVKRVARAIDQVQLKYVLVGGFVAILRGRPRTTTDLDLIIANDPQKIEYFLRALHDADIDVPEAQIRLGLKEGSNVSLFDNLSQLRIDLQVARNPDALDALNTAVAEQFKGVSIWVASVERLLYGKVLYLGDISDIPDSELLEYQDVRDFVNVYREQQKNVHLAGLKELAKRRGLDQTLDRLLATANKKATRQKTLF